MRDRSRTRHADDRLADCLESYLRRASIDWPPSLARLATVDLDTLPNVCRASAPDEGRSAMEDDILVALVVVETESVEDGGFIELGAP